MHADRQEARSAASTDLEIVSNYLDWQYAIKQYSGEFQRQLVLEDRPMPRLDEAREAIARLRAAS